MELIKIDNLSKSYGSVVVLNGLNLSYENGHIYGLVGENGAGKTTMFNCIMRLTEYDGEITRCKDVSVGYMPADSFFYPLITALEHIEFCLKAKGVAIDKAEIEKMNELFELPLDRYAASFSTGMKKKLSFMTLLLQKNDLMILDEPFNGVDLKGCINMRNVIRREKEMGRTFIISSHQIASLREICENIDFLCDHRILKRYTSESVDVIEQDILQRI